MQQRQFVKAQNQSKREEKGGFDLELFEEDIRPLIPQQMICIYCQKVAKQPVFCGPCQQIQNTINCQECIEIKNHGKCISCQCQKDIKQFASLAQNHKMYDLLVQYNNLPMKCPYCHQHSLLGSMSEHTKHCSSSFINQCKNYQVCKKKFNKEVQKLKEHKVCSEMCYLFVQMEICGDDLRTGLKLRHYQNFEKIVNQIENSCQRKVIFGGSDNNVNQQIKQQQRRYFWQRLF